MNPPHPPNSYQTLVGIIGIRIHFGSSSNKILPRVLLVLYLRLACTRAMPDKDRSRSPVPRAKAVKGKGKDNGAASSKSGSKGQDKGRGVAVARYFWPYPHHYEVHDPELDQVYTSFTGKGTGSWQVWSAVTVTGDNWIACNSCGLQWPDWTRRGTNCNQCPECELLPLLPVVVD